MSDGAPQTPGIYPAAPNDAPRGGVLPGGDVQVVIAIASFRRPTMLGELLGSIGGVRFSRETPRVRVLVVDNDAAQSARPVVDAARDRVPFPLEYDVEPVRNIAAARNRAVRLALAAGADFVAFVDDDEVVSPEWIEELLRAQRDSRADVVQGSVTPVFEEPAPSWMIQGGYFELPRHPPGAELATASTNNVLVAASLLAAHEEPFDPRFGISGGSDALFFTRCRRMGARIIWAPAARVSETIPATRARAGWILQRAFRWGNTSVWFERAMERGMRRMHLRVAKAAVRLLAGIVLLPFSVLRGRRGVMFALWNILFGAGAVAALFGYRYLEYRRVHGG